MDNRTIIHLFFISTHLHRDFNQEGQMQWPLIYNALHQNPISDIKTSSSAGTTF